LAQERLKCIGRSLSLISDQRSFIHFPQGRRHMQVAILPLLVVAAQAAFRGGSIKDGAELHASSAISPELDAKSDKHFNKDYPLDKRPVADEHYVFNHPYPAVQDSGDYDADFVKDENSDGGKWKAQMEYDTLRSKIRIAKEKLKELKEKMEKEYEDWMKSKDKSAHADEDAHAAGSKAEIARQAAKKAADKVNELEGSSSADGTKIGGSVGDAIKDVKKEMSDLEKCKKNLADAKKRLKQLLKEKDDFEAKKAAAKKAEEDAEKKAEEEEKAAAKADAATAAKAKKAAAEAKAKKAAADKKDKKKQKQIEEEEEEAAFDEAAWQKKLNREKKDYAEALKKYEQELKDVKLTEDQLARAAAELKKFRRPPYVDGNGGVYNVPKSLAFSMRANVALVLAVLVGALVA